MKSLALNMRVLVALVFLITIFSLPVKAPTNYIIDGDKVYIDDDNVFISAEPHTVYSSGWVYFNLTSKTYSGDIDVAFGFDTNKTKPANALLYKPRNVTEEKSFTCSEPYWFNYTTDPKHAWCWNNVTKTTTNNETNETVTEIETILVFEHDFTAANLSASTIYWNETREELWLDVSSKFDSKVFEHGGMNKWWYVKNIPVEAGKSYLLKGWIKVPIELGSQGGKYWVCLKRSSDTFSEAISNNRFYCLDPWWDSSWNKRRNLTLYRNDEGTARTLEPVIVNVTGLTFT
ncbi:MAG: hypothetical protein ACTSUF_09620, partial [Candidatus Heimdallarchaeaceae archaeon]